MSHAVGGSQPTPIRVRDSGPRKAAQASSAVQGNSQPPVPPPPTLPSGMTDRFRRAAASRPEPRRDARERRKAGPLPSRTKIHSRSFV